MSKVYILRGQGIGDDEDAFENMGAFTTFEKAKAHAQDLRVEDTKEGFEIVYDIETLDLE
jgi:hypothetical protein